MEKTIIEHMSCISEKLRSEKPERLTRMVRSCIDISPENLAKAEEDISAFLGLDYLKFLTYSQDLEDLKRRRIGF